MNHIMNFPSFLSNFFFRSFICVAAIYIVPFFSRQITFLHSVSCAIFFLFNCCKETKRNEMSTFGLVLVVAVMAQNTKNYFNFCLFHYIMCVWWILCGYIKKVNFILVIFYFARGTYILHTYFSHVSQYIKHFSLQTSWVFEIAPRCLFSFK